MAARFNQNSISFLGCIPNYLCICMKYSPSPANMVLDMDSELQRLIYISVEKMTTHPGTSGRGLPGHSARKSRGLDLRKALLVAHVLQDMRTAYISDDYNMLLNTVCPDGITDNERTKFITEYHTTDYLSSKRRRFITGESN